MSLIQRYVIIILMRARIVSLIIGYMFGCFMTADIVSHHYAGRSPDEIGSGNPGMANIMTNIGFKAGILVLAGDLLKTILACLISYFIFQSEGSIIRLYAGLGVVIGHDFPLWRRLHGGKGVSSTCMAIAMFSFWPGLACDLAGMAVVILTGYLPLGAVVIPLTFMIPAFVIGGTEALILTAVMTVIMFSRHYRGLSRAAHGCEKKIMDAGSIRRLWNRYVSKK